MRDTTRRQDTPQNICVLVADDAKENLLLVHNEAMGLIHTPRTIFSIAKGLSKRQWFYSSNGKKEIPFDPLMRDPKTVAFGLNNHHVYQARLGLFDVDYLGHMNNAAYLTHAEFARWELTSYNGMLQTMVKNNIHFLVVGTTIRYRKEMRPIFSKFQIDTSVAGMDDRNLWMMHKFRSLSATNKESRIMAQMVVQGVAVQDGRNVMKPATLFKDFIGLDGALVDSITLNGANRSPTEESKVTEELLERYAALEEAMKKESAEDDKRYR